MSHDSDSFGILEMLERAEQPVDHVLIDIKAKLEGAELRVSEECCIQMVPLHLRHLNKDTYTPKIVSIGPYHLITTAPILAYKTWKHTSSSLAALSSGNELRTDAETQHLPSATELVEADIEMQSATELVEADIQMQHLPSATKLKALRGDYCNTPWRTNASLAGIAILFLTLIESVVQ